MKKYKSQFSKIKVMDLIGASAKMSSESRVYNFLLLFSRNTEFRYVTSYNEIQGALGISRPTVIRCLSGLKTRGLISVKRLAHGIECTVSNPDGKLDEFEGLSFSETKKKMKQMSESSAGRRLTGGQRRLIVSHQKTHCESSEKTHCESSEPERRLICESSEDSFVSLLSHSLVLGDHKEDHNTPFAFANEQSPVVDCDQKNRGEDQILPIGNTPIEKEEKNVNVLSIDKDKDIRNINTIPIEKKKKRLRKDMSFDMDSYAHDIDMPDRLTSMDVGKFCDKKELTEIEYDERTLEIMGNRFAGEILEYGAPGMSPVQWESMVRVWARERDLIPENALDLYADHGLSAILEIQGVGLVPVGCVDTSKSTTALKTLISTNLPVFLLVIGDQDQALAEITEEILSLPLHKRKTHIKHWVINITDGTSSFVTWTDDGGYMDSNKLAERARKREEALKAIKPATTFAEPDPRRVMALEAMERDRAARAQKRIERNVQAKAIDAVGLVQKHDTAQSLIKAIGSDEKMYSAALIHAWWSRECDRFGFVTTAPDPAKLKMWKIFVAKCLKDGINPIEWISWVVSTWVEFKKKSWRFGYEYPVPTTLCSGKFYEKNLNPFFETKNKPEVAKDWNEYLQKEPDTKEVKNDWIEYEKHLNSLHGDN